MTTNDASADAEGAVSPKNTTGNEPQDAQKHVDSVKSSLSSFEARADPDAQATVTDFLDFTEYLPSDMIRSLTLIGQLDQTYLDASSNVHQLTTTWGQLPSLPAEERPAPAQLRADISQGLSEAVSSRSFAHDEAVRMSGNVDRHYHRAKTILAKLQTMMDNYPTEEEQKSPVAVTKSPQLTRAPKPILRDADGERIRRPVVPRITVPGEVLAPYDQFEVYDSDTTDSESEEEDDDAAVTGRTPARSTPAPRIKLVNKAQKTPKPPKTPKAAGTKPGKPGAGGGQAGAAATTPAMPVGPAPKPPPENAVIGSSDAPWLQLTQWEMAQLRKRMKKNATWAPSDTMISRELDKLGRGIDAYREAKKKAEEEGTAFDPAPNAVAAEGGAVTQKTPEGALSVAALKSDEVQLSNRGMKLNEAKKLKRESLAKQAAEEAEESARRFNEQARKLMAPQQQQQQQQQQSPLASKGKGGKAAGSNGTGGPNGPKNGGKRKRDSVTEAEAPKDAAASTETPASRPPAKRTKHETPVPLPQMRASLSSQTLTETPIPPPVLTPGGSVAAAQSNTPVPLPVSGQEASKRTSPALTKETPSLPPPTTNVGPSKPPMQTPIPPPVLSPKKSTTPILPPVREMPRRETRGDAAKKTQQHPSQTDAAGEKTEAAESESAPVEVKPEAAPPQAQVQPAPAVASVTRSASRSRTRSATPAADTTGVSTGTALRSSARPSSSRGGKAASQEPQQLSSDRTRRASTARNTPVPPESQQAAAAAAAAAAVKSGGRRSKRPAPGVVSTTTSGGSSAVGPRKKAPSVKKKVRSQKKEDNNEPTTVVEEEEVDDEGNAIDPNEPRYCVCNRVSFGTMISCDNSACTIEWFHIECVGLTAVPARTTKWYCPDCRVKLNIGEKGEVSARGVKT